MELIEIIMPDIKGPTERFKLTEVRLEFYRCGTRFACDYSNGSTATYG